MGGGNETPVGELQSITVKTPPKLLYGIGDEFDPTGMVVIATYKDESDKDATSTTRELKHTELEISGFDSSKSGSPKLHISYTFKERTESQDLDLLILVKTKELSGLEVTSEPTKKEYLVGETFDFTGMEIKKKYGNAKALIQDDNWVSAEYDFSVSNENAEVKFTYTEGAITVSTTINVKVYANLESIEITTEPTKTDYILDVKTISEEINVTGMVVTAKYSDGSKKTIDNSKCTISPKTVIKSDGRIKTITVSYTENGITKTATFNVSVKVVGELDTGITF